MILKTTGIVLRTAHFSRTSQVVTWLTCDRGRLATAAKGAQRPKSAFLGQYDLFYTCEVLFYARDRNGLHILRECAPVNPRAALRADWKGAACASYVADLVLRSNPEGGVHEGLYDLCGKTLDALAQGAASPQVLFWFELKLAGILGVAPRLDACTSCGCDLSGPPEGVARFSSGRGGLLCRSCAGSPGLDTGGGGRTLSLTAASLDALRLWQATPWPPQAGQARCGPQEMLELRRVLGVFLEFHLDVMPSGRGIALAMVSGAVDAAPAHSREETHG